MTTKTLSVRAQLTEGIISGLFQPDSDRLQRRLSRTLTEVSGTVPNTAFHYKGKTYFVDGNTAIRGAQVVDVPPTLVPQLEAYLQDRAQVEKDRDIIRQLVAALLQECENSQDIRDALPDCIVPANIMQERERSRPVGYPFDSNPRLKRQLDKYHDTIFQYAAAKLLY